MDQNGEHLVKAIDAVARADANEQKMVNHTLRAMQGLGYVARQPNTPWYAVSIDPSRQHSVASGPMPVAIRAETADSKVDTSVSREVVLCGDGVGWWRVQVVEGKADTHVELSGSGEGVLVVVDAAEPDRIGQSPSFTWN